MSYWIIEKKLLTGDVVEKRVDGAFRHVLREYFGSIKADEKCSHALVKVVESDGSAPVRSVLTSREGVTP